MAALNAGMIPNTTPVPAENPNANITDHIGTVISTICGCIEAMYVIA
jgi:hypothetical protein